MKLPALANNLSLPPLSGFQARSTWVQLLLFLTVILNLIGIDLYAVLADMGLGNSQEEVIANGDRAVRAWQELLPFILGVWAWLERRAPHYRLVWPWDRSGGVPPLPGDRA